MNEIVIWSTKTVHTPAQTDDHHYVKSHKEHLTVWKAEASLWLALSKRWYIIASWKSIEVPLSYPGSYNE